jgi:hypothetical protein
MHEVRGLQGLRWGVVRRMNHQTGPEPDGAADGVESNPAEGAVADNGAAEGASADNSPAENAVPDNGAAVGPAADNSPAEDAVPDNGPAVGPAADDSPPEDAVPDNGPAVGPTADNTAGPVPPDAPMADADAAQREAERPAADGVAGESAGRELAAAAAEPARLETGEPRVDAALTLLDRLAELPVTVHAAVFEQVHAELTAVLGQLDPESAGADD